MTENLSTQTIQAGNYVYAPYRGYYVEAQVMSVSGSCAIVTYNVPLGDGLWCSAIMQVKLDQLKERDDDRSSH